MSMMDNPSGGKKKPSKALKNAQARAKKLSNEAKRKAKSLKALQKRVNDAAKRANKLAGKKPTSKKGAAKPKKTSASRTSRGMYAQYLPQRATTYGSSLPDWAKNLGWTGSTVPVLNVQTTPRMGFDGMGTGVLLFDKDGKPVLDKKGEQRLTPLSVDERTFGLDFYGQPIAEAPKKGKATKKKTLNQRISDAVESLADAKSKLLEAQIDDNGSDKNKEKIERLRARVAAADLRLYKLSMTQAMYTRALKGDTKEQLLAKAYRDASAAIKKGLNKEDVKKATVEATTAPPSASTAQQTAAAAGAAAGAPGSTPRKVSSRGGVETREWTWAGKKYQQKFRGQAPIGKAVLVPNPYDDDYLDANPDFDDDDLMMNAADLYYAYGSPGKDGKRKRVQVELERVKAGADGKYPAGTVSVIIGPQMIPHALLTLRQVQEEVKKNGFDSLEMNMARKRKGHKMNNNPLGSDLMELGGPVLGATAGFAASRVVNALALWGLSKANMNVSSNMAQVGVRAAATGLGVAATLMYGDKLGAVVDRNRASIATGMVLNVLEGAVRTFAKGGLEAADANPIFKNVALGDSDDMGYYDLSHNGAPYSPMMGEYVSQSLNGMGEYDSMDGMGEYVSQSLNGDLGSYVAQAAAGVGEYVSQSLNGSGDGIGEYVSQSLNGYVEGVDPSEMNGIDGMIDNAEAVAGVGATEVMAATAGFGATEVMAATAGFGATEVMAATAGLGNEQGMNRGIVTRQGVYNFFTQPVTPSGGRIQSVSIEDAPMPVVPMGGARPGAVPLSEQVATPEGRGYAAGIFGRHLFGTMV